MSRAGSTPHMLLSIRAGAYLAIATLALLATYLLQGLLPDDAFIIYRYARNLAEGLGWTFNPGVESANAATSPLYVLLLAGLWSLFGNMEMLGTAIFALSLIGAGVLLFELLRSRGEWVSGLAAALLLVTAPWIVTTRGMETALFLMLLLASLLLWSRGSEILTGAALGALILTRGEGALFAVILGVGWMVVRRKVPWRMALTAVAMVLPWLVYATVVIGGVTPHTLTAKVAQGSSGFWGEWAFLKGLRDIPTFMGFRTWLLAIIPAAAAGGLLAVWKRSFGVLIPIATMGLAILVSFGIILQIPPYHWYYAVPVTGLVLAAGYGIGMISTSSKGGMGKVLAGISVVYLALLVALSLSQYNGRPVAYPHYQQASDWLRANTDESATVAVTEIGAVGYFSDRQIIDYLGLLDERSAEEVARGDLRSWLDREDPDLWIVHAPAWEHETPAMTLPWFRFAYRSAYETQGLVIYERVIGADEAKAEAAIKDAQLMETIQDQLRAQGLELSGAEEQLVHVLVRLYLIRSDLQEEFGRPRLEMGPYLRWADEIGVRWDPARVVLRPSEGALRSLVEKTKGEAWIVEVAAEPAT